MTAFGHHMLSEWAFAPGLTYLNHGTVGAPPRRVIAAQRAIQDEIEREPARFQLRELADVKVGPMRMRPRMRQAIDAIAPFFHCRPDDLAFVDNATTGVNAVLRSLTFEPGDEIVLTDHGYGAVTFCAEHVARRSGAVVRMAELPWPRFDPGAIVEAVLAAVGPRTRLVIVDHITSGSALILPVAEIVARCHAKGARVLVDGAHVPGALDLDIPSIGADWYTANLHKWAMAPRSSGILWARDEAQADLHPPVISWGYGKGFDAEFDLTGTRDPSPFLAAPAAIAFMEKLGLDAMRTWNESLVHDAAPELAARWKVSLPMAPEQFGSMVTMPLPERVPGTPEAVWKLRDALLYEDRIEVQMHAWRGRAWVRISGQVYVEPADIERLAAAIQART